MISLPQLLEKWVPRPMLLHPLSFFWVALMALSGVTIATGTAEPQRIRALLHPAALLQLWGVLLTVASVVLFWAMMRANLPLEKLGLRFLNVLLLIYAGWVLAAAGVDGIATVVTCVVLALFCEMRVTAIRRVIRPPDQQDPP